MPFKTVKRTGSATCLIDISSSNTISSAIPIGGSSTGMVITPSAITGTALSFLVSDKVSGTFVAPEDAAGDPIALVVEASRAYAIPAAIMAAGAIKLVTAAQAADRTFTVILKS